MKLIVIPSANPHLNTNRRKYPRKRCRCQQYLAEEHCRVAIVAHRDPAHVPQYRPLRIEIGGADQQHSTFDPLSSDLLNERIVHVRLNQFGQGRVVSQRRAFEQTMYVIGKNVLSSVFCKNLAQLTVMLSPQERERGNQRARANARYQIERWPRARIAPTDQEASAEGTVFGTAGDCEKVGYRWMSHGPPWPSRIRLGRIRRHDRLDFLARGITPEADVMKSLDLDLAGARLRQNVAWRDRRAACRQQYRRTDQDETHGRPQRTEDMRA